VSFGGTLSGSIVPGAVVEERKPLLDTVHCFSLSQTNFTTWAKTVPFHRFSDVQRAIRGGRRDL